MKIKLLKCLDSFVGKPLGLLVGYLDHLFCWTAKGNFVPKPKNILVIRPGGLGDFLYLLPSLRLLKDYFPAARIDVLAEKRNLAAAQLTEAIDRLLAYDAKPLSSLLSLIGNRYDLVIDSEQFHNFSALLAYLTRAGARLGFKTNPFRNHLYTHLIDYSLKGQEAFEFMKLLRPLQIKETLPPFERAINRAVIRSAAGPLEIKNYVVIAPRGKEKYRYWAPVKYAAVIDYLAGQGFTAVIIGGAAEAELSRQITQQTNRAISLVGQTSFLQLSRLIMQSELFFGCDSGIAVLASILAPKSVTLFGSADENKWALMDNNHLVIRNQLPCAPCQMLGNYKFCRMINCMAEISAASVIEAIKRLGC